MSGTDKTPDPEGQGSGDLLGATIRAKFRPSRALMATVKAKPPAPPPPPKRTTAARLAHQLSLAHWIERAIESGEIACYADVARTLGLTQSRITQITALLGLSPAIQERVLLEGGLGIRAALRAAREVDWEEQSKAYPT